MAIVVDPPSFGLGARVLDRQELRNVQTLIAQSPVEGFYVPVLRGVPGMDEVELRATVIRPLLASAPDDVVAGLRLEAYIRLGPLWLRGTSMLAAVYERTGPASEVLSIEDLPTPTPGPYEVRVRVAWSGVYPSDVKSRAGVRSKTLPFPRVVPHSDGSGVIDQVGDGVDPARIGERVWLWNAAWTRAFGSAAQYVVLPAPQAVSLPADVDLAVGACLGIPALTAYHAVTVDGGVRGKSVLVAGGAGAVGHYAIQMAKLTGAKQVLASVSSEEKGALAREAGADVVVNYRSEDIVKKCLEATTGDGVDRIIEVDLAANVTADLAALRPEGDIIVYGSGAPGISVPFVPAILKNVCLRFFIVYNLSHEDRTRAIEGLTQLLAAKGLLHNIAVRLPLSRIADAHDLVEHGKAIGNVVLEVD